MHSLRRIRTAAWFAVAGAFLLLPSVAFLVPAATAAVPNYKGASADGEVVFFDTEAQLVPGDTDTKRDVYMRSFDEDVGDYVTREVSLGPSGGTDAYAAHFDASDTSGERVFFSTEERLVPEDTDRQLDVYMRDLDKGTTTLVSAGFGTCLPKCGNQAVPVTFADADALGNVVLFSTAEQLTAGDQDESVDLYVRDIQGGHTELVSGGSNGSAPVTSFGLSADGSHAFFTTSERLLPDDTDSALDIYARDVEAGILSLASRGNCGGCGNSGQVPIFEGSTDDGDRVFFSTEEDLNGADEDAATDIYARDLPGGPTILISGGEEEVTASFAAASADGAHVFFTSAESLGGGDNDAANDVYEWTGGVLELVTTAICSGPCGVIFDAVSADSSAILFTTFAKLDSADEDARADIYRQEVGGGAPELVSRGDDGCPACLNGDADANFNDASDDATRVIFTTSEGLLEEDEDGENDIYLRDLGTGTIKLITTSPSYCPQKKGSCGATFVGGSEEGQRVFFLTVERFTLEDGNNDPDIYERSLGAGLGPELTRLVSTGNSPDLALGPEAPILLGTDPESPASSTSPRVLGEAMPGSTVKLYTTTNCSGEPVATGTAEQLLDPGLQVLVEPSSLTTYRAAAEAEGFVSLCSGPLVYQQVPGAGGGGEEGGGAGGEEELPPGPGPSASGEARASGAAPSLLGPTFVMPRTRITFAPAAKTRSRSPIFRFTDATGQPETRFECKVDRMSWKGCASPLRLKRLDAGRHVVQVRGVNAVGVAEPAVAKRAFKVVPR